MASDAPDSSSARAAPRHRASRSEGGRKAVDSVHDLTSDVSDFGPWTLKMSRNVQVRNLDDGLVPRLKRREVEPSFFELAASLRKLTRGRRHTPAELLQREGRDQR